MTLKTVDTNTLKAWLEKGEAVLVDVREPMEHAAEHIPGALHVPLAKLSTTTLPHTEFKKLVIHCKSGKRGGVACEKLLAEDPNLELYNLEGGLDAWERTGYPVKISGNFFLPLDQQVQLAIGIGVILGSTLGYFVHPKWFLLSGFFGLGLFIAGLTGWCGLALLMAKMPWNQRRVASHTCCTEGKH